MTAADDPRGVTRVSLEQREGLARALHDSHTTRLCVGPAVNPDCEACHNDADTVIAAGWTPPGVSPEVMQVADAVDQLARTTGMTHTAAADLLMSVAKKFTTEEHR